MGRSVAFLIRDFKKAKGKREVGNFATQLVKKASNEELESCSLAEGERFALGIFDPDPGKTGPINLKAGNGLEPDRRLVRRLDRCVGRMTLIETRRERFENDELWSRLERSGHCKVVH